jgi:hypothetical protein
MKPKTIPRQQSAQRTTKPSRQPPWPQQHGSAICMTFHRADQPVSLMLISLRAKDPALGSCPGNWAPPELFVYLKGYHLCQYINMYQGKLALISSTVDCSHGCL